MSEFVIPAGTETFKLAPWIPKISFHDQNNNLVGTLVIENGTMRFEGNADESAKVFFENIIKLYGEKK